MKAQIASSVLTALLAAGLLGRLVGYGQSLEWLNYILCLFVGLIIGMGHLEQAWRRYHDHQRRALRELSAKTREELYLASFFRGCPYASLFSEEYHILTETPRKQVPLRSDE